MRIAKNGFTVVELVIVITVVSILATLTIMSYSSAQAAARDAKRKSDLATIGEAIQLYRQKYGDDLRRATVKSTSGSVEVQCGSNGAGWFNYSAGGGTFENPASGNIAYQSSMLKCLVDNGYLNHTFIDPYNCTTGSGNNGAPDTSKPCQKAGYAYMKYTSGSGDSSYTCLFARLETEDYSAELLDTANSPCAGSATRKTSQGMNYMVRFD